MGYQLSYIASDIQGNRSVGLDEDRFFEPGNAAALAKKIVEYANRALTQEERQRQIDIIVEKYDWGKIALRTLQVYRMVIGYYCE